MPSPAKKKKEKKKENKKSLKEMPGFAIRIFWYCLIRPLPVIHEQMTGK